MNIIEPNEQQLNDFVLKNGGSFQQSWQWGELQERMGRKTNRLLIIDNNNRAVASTLFIKHDLPLGKYYLLCPRGPVISQSVILEPRVESRGDRISKVLRDSIASLQNDKNCIFIRIEPELPLPLPARSAGGFGKEGRSRGVPFGFQRAPKDHNPRAIILIDLEKTEEQLLSGMHSKTRYNLKLAEKKGVKILDFRLQIADFLELMEKTAKRDNFHLHPRKYYEELLRMEEIKLFGAYHEDRLVAAAMVSFWGENATYLHGATDYDFRQLMAPYLLHWEIIRQAKREGLKYYDLGGVAPKDEPNHPLAGVTRFKSGFGGEYIEYLGSWDWVIDSFWYGVYKIARRVL